ncbi:PP2C family protein-serine/threonine phosphatase [Streptomyces beihaiensis]|uniref:Serine/threonine-protein phosphatase n=1 Tax=Streptomyces beihaiensis TaxID=2984495 RepID=A0ABT3TSS0_9ACTN|nr:PP2C family protein-serine/threonine phosphatase [Streptomyces beihaiensis]MCX3060079.1 serine/threonine-protein phosphatase [Streptomyces beihaiensis]
MTWPVQRRRDGEERAWLRGAPPPPWVRWLPLALLVGLLTAQELTPQRLDLGFLLSAVPPLAALSYGPAVTTLLGGVVVTVVALPHTGFDRPGNADLVTVVFVAVLSVALAWVRSRRDEQLVTVRTVAEAAQFAVLPPLPERVGAVRCAGLYRAAQRGALVGGDFFDVRRAPGGVRAVVGDVQGHGLSAVGTVAGLLGAFREAVLDQPDLRGVAERLDRRLVVDAGQDENAELFATAVLFEFPDDSPVVRVISCGHPRPLLLRGTAVCELPVRPAAPLGLGIAGLAPPEPLTLGLEPGDRLLAQTDGVTEARNAAGDFYPLLARLPRFAGEEPAALTDAVWRDVVRFSGTVRDDLTLLVFAPDPPGDDPDVPAGG